MSSSRSRSRASSKTREILTAKARSETHFDDEFVRDFTPKKVHRLVTGSARGCAPSYPLQARSVLRSLDQNRPIDRFDETIEEYVELIRVEGQKALSLAKLQMKADIIREREIEFDDLRSRSAETEEKIVTLEKELESRGDLIRKLSRQLNGFAALASRRNPVFVSQLVGSYNSLEEGTKLLLERWRVKAASRRRDREDSRVYIVLYRMKLSMRAFSSWRLYASTSSMAKDSAERIGSLESEWNRKMNLAILEKESGARELDSVKQELLKEQERRGHIFERIQSLFKVKCEDIFASSEMHAPILCLPKVSLLGDQEVSKPLVSRRKNFR